MLLLYKKKKKFSLATARLTDCSFARWMCDGGSNLKSQGSCAGFKVFKYCKKSVIEE